jgi:ribonuclease HII
MITANFEQEEHLLASGFDLVLGIDEAGRGPLAGPVVASVCVLKLSGDVGRDAAMLRLYGEDKKWNLIRDSKTLSEKQREIMFDFIHEHFYVGVGICDHLTIDRMNILEASFLAMKKAVTDFQNTHKELLRNKNCIVLVDGNKVIPSFSLEQVAIVSGDKLVKSIAAASIIAKVTRDRIICEADKLYPEYGLAKHKGYGTKKHMEALKKYGSCPIHRQSFEPMKSWTKRAKGCYYKGVKYQLNP